MVESTIPLLVSQLPALVLLIGNIIQARLLNRRSFAMAEFAMLEKRCIRLQDENKALQVKADEYNQEIGKLKERTDLQPVIRALELHNSESNVRFDKAIQIQAEQSRLLAANSELLTANTEAIKTLTRSHEEMILHLFPGRENTE